MLIDEWTSCEGFGGEYMSIVLIEMFFININNVVVIRGVDSSHMT